MWGQFTQIISSLSPKRDCGPKRVKGSDGTDNVTQYGIRYRRNAIHLLQMMREALFVVYLLIDIL